MPLQMEDLKSLEKGFQPKSTKRATNWAVKAFTTG